MSAESVRLGLTAGDPAGIGPEIVVKLLADGTLAATPVRIFAEPALFTAECERQGVPVPAAEGPGPVLSPVDVGPVPSDFRPGSPSAFTGRVSAACVRSAARRALDGELDGIVTAPLSKSALRAAGEPYPGHTEMLADLAGASSVAMMFVAGDLRLALATIHVPLSEVAATLTAEGIVEVVRLVRECLGSRAGIRDPRIALLGLNPHAGEGGLFGDEEERILRPALEEASGRGWRMEGPYPADSYFLRHLGDHDGVVAMYHDQGLIPVKLLSEGRAVNVTLGLPFLRTSVDHGTAFDLAGSGRADPESLREALRLAARWTGGA